MLIKDLLARIMKLIAIFKIALFIKIRLNIMVELYLFNKIICLFKIPYS